MIIDSHAHLMMMPSLTSFHALVKASNGQHGYETRGIVSDEELEKAAKENIAIMDAVGTDVQLLSPRPFLLMHSHTDKRAVNAWVRANNDCIHRMTKLYPKRFYGVAGLPQAPGESIEGVFAEIDRTVNDLGFVGIMINPDPGEGLGTTPHLGDPYWYPLWEKMISMDLPGHIHSAGCCGRETYDEHFISEESLAITSIAREDVFKRFPKLKLMISHGGGSVPYQVGRWKSNRLSKIAHAKKHGDEAPELFEDTLKRFYFDTCLHHKKSLELLFDLVGSDRCLFGTERPGSGGAIDPDTGRPFDDLKPVIESIGDLNDEDRQNIFEANARRVFTRLK